MKKKLFKVQLILLLASILTLGMIGCESEEPHYDDIAFDLHSISSDLYEQIEEAQYFVKLIYDSTNDEKIIILAEDIMGRLNEIEYITDGIYSYHEELREKSSSHDPDYNEDRDYIWTW